MSFPKLMGLIAVLLFGIISLIALFKESKPAAASKKSVPTAAVEVDLDQNTAQDVRIVPTRQSPPKNTSATSPAPSPAQTAKAAKQASLKKPKVVQPIAASSPVSTNPQSVRDDKRLPEANRINEFFNVEGLKLPIVETITYKSRVSWQKGRPAWLADYARYYQTSRHFIARSLNGKPDYFKQDLVENARFNVLRKDKNIQFYLLVDLSRCRMWFYYDDLDSSERVLLKTYQVGLGRVDGSKASGFLTPIGKYSLGNKVAIYKPKMMGYHNGEHVEMVGTFGTRWIPFDKEISGCSVPAKGLGMHGLSWNLISGERVQDRSSLGKYQSDGCVRLASEDVEEIFAIIITKPAIIELVKDFHDAKQL